MNTTILMGRLVRDPEIRYTQGGVDSKAIARYTVAVDRRRRSNASADNQPTADFIPCVAFGKSAEFAEKYLKKGMRILVRGSIRTGSYENKDGQKVYTTDVWVDDQEFCESKNSGSGSSNAASTPDNTAVTYDEPINEGFMCIPDGIEDEGLPFN